MPAADAPVLAGIHHLKLPVSDLARSLEWYRSRLGYQVQVEFVEQGTLMGCGLAHPAGGPDLGLRLDPDRARAAAGFDYFAIGVPDKATIDRLARRLDELGARRRAPGQPGLDPARGARPGRAHAALLHHGAPHRRSARPGSYDPRSQGNRRTPRARASQPRVARRRGGADAHFSSTAIMIAKDLVRLVVPDPSRSSKSLPNGPAQMWAGVALKPAPEPAL